MAITSFEMYFVQSEYVTVDLIIWKRYRNRCPGIVEKTLDANPQLSWGHRTSPFLPVGTFIRIPIDPVLILGKPAPIPTENLWTDRAGYRI
jgi:phage tail protein X